MARRATGSGPARAGTAPPSSPAARRKTRNPHSATAGKDPLHPRVHPRAGCPKVVPRTLDRLQQAHTKQQHQHEHSQQQRRRSHCAPASPCGTSRTRRGAAARACALSPRGSPGSCPGTAPPQPRAPLPRWRWSPPGGPRGRGSPSCASGAPGRGRAAGGKGGVWGEAGGRKLNATVACEKEGEGWGGRGEREGGCGARRCARPRALSLSLPFGGFGLARRHLAFSILISSFALRAHTQQRRQDNPEKRRWGGK